MMNNNDLAERKEINEEEMLDVNGGNLLDMMQEKVVSFSGELVNVISGMMDQNKEKEPEKEIISDDVFNDYYIV